MAEIQVENMRLLKEVEDYKASECAKKVCALYEKQYEEIMSFLKQNIGMK